MQELLSHAESSKTSTTSANNARRAIRHPRCGNLTLYPVTFTSMNSPMQIERPRVVASLSNVSRTGMGIVHSEALPTGSQFDLDWHDGETSTPIRLQVVHSKRTSLGLYRTGARLVEGTIPGEFELSVPPTESIAEESTPVIAGRIESLVSQAEVLAEAVIEETTLVEQIDAEEEYESSAPRSYGVLKYDPDPVSSNFKIQTELPPGTFQISSANGFDKTEKLAGVTSCGWDRSIEMRRVGGKLWIYIHTPGKKNGWGIYVDADEFEKKFGNVQQSAVRPFITSLAA